MSHADAQSASGRHRGRLQLVFAITLGIMIAEVVAGFISGSLALLADAGHMLTDVAGIGLALVAIRLSARPASDDRTFGWYRLEILAAVINAVLLFGVAVYVLIEAWRRLAEPRAFLPASLRVIPEHPRCGIGHLTSPQPIPSFNRTATAGPPVPSVPNSAPLQSVCSRGVNRRPLKGVAPGGIPQGLNPPDRIVATKRRLS